jgi:3-dehydroquinate dehydratase / shikimate dehydrogenase
VNKPRLCVTVTAPSTAELRRRRDAVRDADVLELRLDGVADPNVAGALAGRRLPLIITCRPEWEGGRFAGSEEERRRILGDALTRGAEFVDVEWRAGFDDLIAQTDGRRIVLSSHDFDSIPADLSDRARAMRATGADIVKLAVTANRLSDCVPMAELGAAFGGGIVLIAMGPRGLITRVLPQRFSSEWSYGGSLDAVGQLSPDAMLNLYRFRSLGAGTALYGLVGSPIDHSVSPDMHNAALAATAVDGVYLPLPAADAADFVTFARAFGLKGASITIPFKVSLFDHVDEVVALARRVGAINTLAVDGTRWIGGNTDVAGFMQSLIESSVPMHRLRAAVLGAGGAARGVSIALSEAGADVTVHARDTGRAADTARAVGVQAASWPPPSGSWDLLVNCTPVGMYPRVDQSPIPASALSGRYVYDLVYNPPATRLLRDAAAAGCTTFGGLDMLVAQAQEQFSWWTGIKAPAGVMRAAAERRLTEFIADENHVV